MSMVMIGAKVPPSWKEIIEKLAKEKGLDQSEVIREILNVGLRNMKEVNTDLSDLAKEGEIILKGKRALALRKVIGHFGGHQAGWRTTAERIENRTVQDAYLDISERMRNEVMDFLEKRKRLKGKRTLIEYLWDKKCLGCTYRLIRDEDFCRKNCRVHKEWFEAFKKRGDKHDRKSV